MKIPDLVIAGIFGLFGIRSLVKWLGTPFETESVQDQALFSLHVWARVSLWFAMAGGFVGFALLDEPQRFGWYIFVPVSLAGVQLVTAVFLSRSPGGERKVDQAERSEPTEEANRQGSWREESASQE